MGNITQCPQCGTRFRVVADQLKLSEGWVRCGQCSEVFDAAASMVVLPASAPDAPPEATTGAQVNVVEMADVPVDLPMSEPVWAPAPVPVPTPEPETEPETVPPAPAIMAVAADAAEALRIEPTWEPEPAAPVSAFAPEPTPEPPADSPEPDAPASTENAPAEPEVSFVRQARREAFWAKPWVRAVQAVVALVLALVLLLQVAVHRRDWLATAYPASVPWLTALCQPVGCEIGALHQLESITIDSISFLDLRNGKFRLEVSLRNASAHRLAIPALELSLTNLRDEVVVRKVIGPHDWSQPTTDLPARSDLPLSVQLAVSNASELRMSGYRAIIFYP